MAVDTNYFLLYSQQFDRDSGLDYGRLSLNSMTKGTLEVWVATSSLASKQQAESFHQTGGLLPPQYRVPGLKFWTVKLSPIPMPGTKGVEGNFYKIDPHTVTTDKGGVRGDFGIHKDANVPGSMGCIVLTPERFASFEKRIASIKPVAEVPLFVQYS